MKDWRQHKSFPQSLAIGSLLLILLVTSGCAQLREWSNWEDEEDEAPAVSDESVPEIPPYRYRQVIEWLQAGEWSQAERALRARLEEEPDDQRAQSLLEQLEADPKTYLGESSFEHQVSSGETLSLLAQQYLGDSRKFLILARYNDIEVPARLRLGQRLNIPSEYADHGGETRSEIDDTPMAERTSVAWSHLEANDAKAVLDLYRDVSESQLNPEDRRVLAEAHEAWFESALQKGELALAENRLAEARETEPTEADWSAWLSEAQTRLDSELLFQQGQAQMQSDPVEAARAFGQVLALNPEHAKAQAALDELQESVVPEMHREAILHYRNHELDEAISLWETLLVIAPEFEPAQAYKARASELQARLEALD